MPGWPDCTKKLTFIVQPKFIELAKLWKHLQHQLYILSAINSVNEQLMVFADIQNQHLNIEQHEQLTTTDTTTTSPTTVPTTAVTLLTNDGVNDSVNGDKNDIDDSTKKVCRLKIMASTNNELIKIVPFEADKKVCSRTRFLMSHT